MTGKKILFWSLILGGIPPMASGIVAVFFQDFYFQFVGAGVPDMFAGDTYGLTAVILNLQGGDAFVAGSSRVLIAFLGGLMLMRTVAFIGIFHSIYEIWLLSQRLIPWCGDTLSAQCGNLFYAELWGFIALHIILVFGFCYGIIKSLKANPV